MASLSSYPDLYVEVLTPNTSEFNFVDRVSVDIISENEDTLQ